MLGFIFGIITDAIVTIVSLLPGTAFASSCNQTLGMVSDDCNQYIKRFKQLKTMWSPMLLMLFITECLMLIGTMYFTALTILFEHSPDEYYWPTTTFMLTYSILALLILYYIALVAEQTYYQFKAHAITLRKEALDVEDTDKTEYKKLMLAIYEIETETGFKAGGFFTVDCTTFTALGGIILTYLIILLQWKDPLEIDHCEVISNTLSTIDYANLQRHDKFIEKLDALSDKIFATRKSKA